MKKSKVFTNEPLKILNLCKPLIFKKIDELPSFFQENDEFILCFETNLSESRKIEPDFEHFLGKLMFTAKAQTETQIESSTDEMVEMPAGQYLFMQFRAEKPLDQAEWLDMAIEQQKDGLWERHKPENTLYVRYIYEDSKYVTQVFRPLNIKYT